MPTQRQSLSAVLIAHDAATQLRDCLESLAFVDEIVLIDSGSTDGTPELARALGARVVHHAWLGFGPQKQLAVRSASHDWVLSVDCDERISPALARAIEAALVEPAHGGYLMARANFFMGRYLRHGEGYPDWCLRLFDRRVANWSNDPVHEKVVTTAGTAHLPVDAPLLHHSAESLSAYLDKQNRYTSLQAERMLAAGAQVSAARIVLAPLARFIKFYVFKRGFLDGLPGLVHIAIGCFTSFLKYAKVRAERATEGATERAAERK